MSSNFILYSPLQLDLEFEAEERATHLKASLSNLADLADAVHAQDEAILKGLIPFIHQFSSQNGGVDGDKFHIVGLRLNNGKTVIIDTKFPEVYGEGCLPGLARRITSKPPPKDMIMPETAIPQFMQLVLDTTRDAIQEYAGVLALEGDSFDLTEKDLEGAVATLGSKGLRLESWVEGQKIGGYRFDLAPLEGSMLSAERK